MTSLPRAAQTWFRARVPPAAILVVALLLLALLWGNSRILRLRVSQDPARPTVPSAYYVYHGMAMALEKGRVGQLDLARFQRYAAGQSPLTEYPPEPSGSQVEFVNYYSLDIGYAFIVELARLSFPTLPDNYWRALALQLFVDVATAVGIGFLFSGRGAGLALSAALLYLTNLAFLRLVAVPFYYYWDVPISLGLLAALRLAVEQPRRARLLLCGAAVLLGCAVWVRASWWPLATVFFGMAALSRALRPKLLPALAIFAVLAAPQVWRSSRARGQFSLSTRATWHVALVGLGYHPNAYGLQANDESVFRRTREKYGVVFPMNDYAAQDAAARLEYLAILRKDPAFVVRSFFGRLWDSVLGIAPDNGHVYPGLPNPLHRALCLLGLVSMHRSGGARRFLGWSAFALWASYVGLTCLFYFVGAAYDNVPQACLLFLLIGLVEAMTGVAAGTRHEATAR
jgi:hypothetical protein